MSSWRQAMYDDSPIDSSLLSLYVHQNYPSFCQEIEQADALCDWLSLTDRYLSSESVSRNYVHLCRPLAHAVSLSL
jgi:hypothetical protein